MADFREVFAKAKHIAIITGAGVSAESGVPTFRGAGGFWRKWQAQVRTGGTCLCGCASLPIRWVSVKGQKKLSTVEGGSAPVAVRRGQSSPHSRVCSSSPCPGGVCFVQLQLVFCPLVYRWFGKNNVLADSSGSFYYPCFCAALQLSCLLIF